MDLSINGEQVATEALTPTQTSDWGWSWSHSGSCYPAITCSSPLLPHSHRSASHHHLCLTLLSSFPSPIMAPASVWGMEHMVNPAPAWPCINKGSGGRCRPGSGFNWSRSEAGICCHHSHNCLTGWELEQSCALCPTLQQDQSWICDRD